MNFPRPGDEERELVEQPRQPLGHPHGSTREIPTREAKPSQPASPALRRLSSLSPAAPRAGRRRASAASGAAAPAPGRPVAPHGQPPLPEPLLHRPAAPQPPPGSPQPPLRSSSTLGSASPQQERCQYIATPSRASAGESPPPRGRPRPIGGRRGPGSPRARSPPPAPSCTPSAVPGAPAAGVQRGEHPEAQPDTTPLPVKPKTRTGCEAEVDR